MTNMNLNLEKWMTNLPMHLKDIPIINLAIPGSHDSMTYGIKVTSPVAPDADDAVRTISKYFPCIVKRWAVTQSLSTYNQLSNGIRYLDLRFCYKRENDKFYFVHGLYSMEIIKPLYEIRKFLDENNEEVVILDCQHFYNFTKAEHRKLSKILLEIFDSKIYSREDNRTLFNCTLNNMILKSKQVIIIYRARCLELNYFWENYHWPTPWPNKIDTNQLEDFLEQSLMKRIYGSGYVTQCVLTPTSKFIAKRFYSSLRKACAKPVYRNLFNWIEKQTPGPYSEEEKPTCNVFLADFIDLKNGNFCDLIVSLNYKIPEKKMLK